MSEFGEIPQEARDFKAPEDKPVDNRSSFEKIRAQLVNESKPGQINPDQIKEQAIEKLFTSGKWDWVSEVPNFEQDGRAIMTNLSRTYNKNNGVITAVTPEGSKMVAPFDSDLEASLLAAGFEMNSAMVVPYSNEGPKHPAAQERWKNLQEEHKRSESNK